MNNSIEYTIYAKYEITESLIMKTQGGIWKKAKGDYQDRVHSDQMVLVIARWGGWTVWAVAKGKIRGTTGVESTQIRWFLSSQMEEAGLCE